MRVSLGIAMALIILIAGCRTTVEPKRIEPKCTCGTWPKGLPLTFQFTDHDGEIREIDYVADFRYYWNGREDRHPYVPKNIYLVRVNGVKKVKHYYSFSSEPIQKTYDYSDRIQQLTIYCSLKSEKHTYSKNTQYEIMPIPVKQLPLSEEAKKIEEDAENYFHYHDNICPKHSRKRKYSN